ATARLLLERFGIDFASHTLAIGPISVPEGGRIAWEAVAAIPEDSDIRCADETVGGAMRAAIDRARREGESLGGAIQVIGRGIPPGLGSCRLWDTRLEARLGQALLSIHSVKAVEIGEAIAASTLGGSHAHDPIQYDVGTRRFFRATNRAGGLEGGMTNGEEVRATAFLKPLSTLPRPLPSVDLIDKTAAGAAVERTDTCVVPVVGVIAEAMTAIVVAEAFLEKFGGDSIAEIERNVRGYRAQLEAF
ncbi:MAG: chorismate synthase, partial [Acidobacteriota bacterium]|nr:chorismate synthase [Acidobacteriota bacterium]